MVSLLEDEQRNEPGRAAYQLGNPAGNKICRFDPAPNSSLTGELWSIKQIVVLMSLWLNIVSKQVTPFHVLGNDRCFSEEEIEFPLEADISPSREPLNEQAPHSP